MRSVPFRMRVGIFTLVGMAGYLVQTGVLWLLVGGRGWAVVPATLVATEAAVLHNFVWHLRWTWADRPAGPREAAARLLRFNVSNGGFSLVGGAAIMALLADVLGVHYLAANLVAVLVVSIVNFLASDRFVFTTAAAGRAADPTTDHGSWSSPEGVGGRGAFHLRAARTGEGHASTDGNGPDRTRARGRG